MIEQMNANIIQPPIPHGISYVLEPRSLKFPDIYREEGNEENSVYLQSQYLINYLSKIYIFKNPQEIKMFLLSNRDLIEILVSAPEHIRRIFGNVPIYLELHHDPEEDWDELFIVIRSNYSPRKASELKNMLFDEWFIYIIDKVATRLNYTEEPL